MHQLNLYYIFNIKSTSLIVNKRAIKAVICQVAWKYRKIWLEQRAMSSTIKSREIPKKNMGKKACFFKTLHIVSLYIL